MSRQLRTKNLDRRYITQKVKHLKRLASFRSQLQKQALAAGRSVIDDIADGWSTGSKCLDFALVAADGIYDNNLVLFYQQFEQLILRSDKKHALVVQLAMYEQDIIRNIYLVQLRAQTIAYDINKTLMGIPVYPWYYVFRESINPDSFDIDYTEDVLDFDTLYVGPAQAPGQMIPNAQRGKDALYEVPLNINFDLSVQPWDANTLFTTFGIEQDHVDWMQGRWTRLTHQKRSRSER